MSSDDMAFFRQWQIEHYTERLAAARSTEERAFLRDQLYKLKQPIPEQ